MRYNSKPRGVDARRGRKAHRATSLPIHHTVRVGTARGCRDTARHHGSNPRGKDGPSRIGDAPSPLHFGSLLLHLRLHAQGAQRGSSSCLLFLRKLPLNESARHAWPNQQRWRAVQHLGRHHPKALRIRTGHRALLCAPDKAMVHGTAWRTASPPPALLNHEAQISASACLRFLLFDSDGPRLQGRGQDAEGPALLLAALFVSSP